MKGKKAATFLLIFSVLVSSCGNQEAHRKEIEQLEEASLKATSELEIAKEFQFKAAVLKESSDSLVNFVRALKQKLVLLADKNSSNDYQKGKTFLIDERNASFLKKEIKTFEKTVFSLINDTVTLNKIILIKDSTNGIPWEEVLFSDMPIIASITQLSKIQSDARTNEAFCITYLYKKILALEKEN